MRLHEPLPFGKMSSDMPLLTLRFQGTTTRESRQGSILVGTHGGSALRKDRSPGRSAVRSGPHATIEVRQPHSTMVKDQVGAPQFYLQDVLGMPWAVRWL